MTGRETRGQGGAPGICPDWLRGFEEVLGLAGDLDPADFRPAGLGLPLLGEVPRDLKSREIGGRASREAPSPATVRASPTRNRRRHSQVVWSSHSSLANTVFDRETQRESDKAMDATTRRIEIAAEKDRSLLYTT